MNKPERWIDIEDVYIDRDNDSPCAIAYDTEGNELYSFPWIFEDKHILAAIRCANRAYQVGLTNGRRDVAYMLRQIIGLAEIPNNG